jgi:hypothetical protein
MEKLEKLNIMDKVLRELEDLVNSETALIKKLGQLEAHNINLGDKTLEKKLPAIYEHVDQVLTETTSLQTEYSEIRDKFVKDNKLDELIAAQAVQ